MIGRHHFERPVAVQVGADRRPHRADPGRERPARRRVAVAVQRREDAAGVHRHHLGAPVAHQVERERSAAAAEVLGRGALRPARRGVAAAVEEPDRRVHALRQDLGISVAVGIAGAEARDQRVAHVAPPARQRPPVGLECPQPVRVVHHQLRHGRRRRRIAAEGDPEEVGREAGRAEPRRPAAAGGEAEHRHVAVGATGCHGRGGHAPVGTEHREATAHAAGERRIRDRDDVAAEVEGVDAAVGAAHEDPGERILAEHHRRRRRQRRQRRRPAGERVAVGAHEPYPSTGRGEVGPLRIGRGREVGRAARRQASAGRGPDREGRHQRPRPAIETRECVIGPRKALSVHPHREQRGAVRAQGVAARPAHLEGVVAVGVHRQQLRPVGREIGPHRPSRQLPGARGLEAQRQPGIVEEVEPQVGTCRDVGLERRPCGVRERRVVAHEPGIVGRPEQVGRAEVAEVHQGVGLDHREPEPPRVGIHAEIGIGSQRGVDREVVLDRDHALVHVPDQDPSARQRGAVGQEPRGQQRVVLQRIRRLRAEHHAGERVLVELHQVSGRDEAVLEQQVLVRRQGHAPHVGVAFAVLERDHRAVVDLGRVQHVGGVAAVPGIDARRQQAGGEDLAAVEQLHARTHQVAAVHQAPVADHRQSAGDAVDVEETEDEVTALVREHAVDRAVEAVLVVGLGDDGGPVDRDVGRVGTEDHAVAVIHADRETRNVLGAVLPEVALQIAAGVDEDDAIVAVPRDAVTAHDGLRIGGEQHGAEHVERGRIDVLAERPRSEVRHVAHRVGAVLVARPDLGLEIGAAVRLRAIVAPQRLGVLLVEGAVVRGPIDRGHQGVRPGEIEAPVAGGPGSAAVVEEIDPQDGESDGLHAVGARRGRRGSLAQARPDRAVALQAPVHRRRPIHARSAEEIRKGPPPALARLLRGEFLGAHDRGPGAEPARPQALRHLGRNDRPHLEVDRGVRIRGPEPEGEREDREVPGTAQDRFRRAWGSTVRSDSRA